MTSGISDRFVVRWPGYREVYRDFMAAKIEMLDMLWWWAEDIREIDHMKYVEVMKTWEFFAKADTVGPPRRDFFKTTIADENYILVRYRMEEEYGLRTEES